MGRGREWWVHATACHRSIVGPYDSASEAATYADVHRSHADGWRKVSIISNLKP